MEENPFGEWLHEKIKAQWGDYFSQNAIARKLGMSTGLLSLLLNGKVKATHKTLEKIIKSLNLSPEEVRELQGYPSPGQNEAHTTKKHGDALLSSSSTTLPTLMTVRRHDLEQLSGIVERLSNGRANSKRIALLLAHPGDGRTFLANSVTNVACSKAGLPTEAQAIHNIDLNGWYLRHRALYPEDLHQSEDMNEESLADAILGFLNQPSPRREITGTTVPVSQSSPSASPSQGTCVDALAAYFRTHTRPKQRPLLTLHYPSLQETPNSAVAGQEMMTLISHVLSDLVIHLIEKAPALRILLACPIGFDHPAVERYALPRLSREDLLVLAMHQAPDEPLLRRLLENLEKIPAFTVDQYALLFGRIRDRLATLRISKSTVDIATGLDADPFLEQVTLSELHALWNKEIGPRKHPFFTEHPVLRVTFDHGISHDTSSVQEITCLYRDLTDPQRTVLTVATLFPDEFSVGDIRRIFEYGAPPYPLSSDTIPPTDNKWWREGGVLRQTLHELLRAGWLFTEFQSSNRGFRFRVRISLKIFLDHMILAAEPAGLPEMARHYRHQVQRAYCLARLSEEDDIYYRGVYFRHQVDSLRHKLNSLFIGLTFAREIQDFGSFFRLSISIARLYSAEAQWSHTVELMTSALSSSLFTAPSKEKQLDFSVHRYRYRLLFTRLAACFQLDCYWEKLPAEEEQRLREFWQETYTHGKKRMRCLPDLSSECGYWFLFLVRQANICLETVSDPEESVQQALVALEKGLKRTRKLRHFFAERGLRQKHFIAHLEVVDLEHSLCIAHYWRARTAAQTDVTWRTDKKKAEYVRNLFRKAIAEAERAESYRELVFSLIWLARVDLLCHERAPEQWDRAERHLVQAATYVLGADNIPGGDQKVNNLLQSNWDLLLLKKMSGDGMARKRILERLSGSYHAYQVMGESYWASFSKTIVAGEVAATNVSSALDYLEQVIQSWKSIEMRCQAQETLIAPPVLFVDMMNDACCVIMARLDDATSKTLLPAQTAKALTLRSSIDHWHTMRNSFTWSNDLKPIR